MISKKKFIEKTVPYYLLGIIFGYPILTVCTLFIGIQSTALSITYRFIFLCIGVLLIIASVMVNKGMKFIKSGLPFIFFWAVYSLVLINDISIEGIRMGNKSPAYLYSFAFGSSMMTFVAIFFCGKFLKFNLSFLTKIFYTVLFGNVIIALYLMKTGGVSVEALAVRASIDTATGNVLNPITIGQFGVFGAVTSGLYYKLVEKKGLLINLISLFGLLLGVGNVFLGASRGPMLVGALLTMLIVYYFISYYRITRLFVVKSWLIVLSILIGMVTVVIPYLSSIKIGVFNRLGKMFDEKISGKKEIRDYEWESAIRQFLEHPILGDKYINDFDKFYPHNVYLEVLMSTGVVGGAMFFTGIAIGLYNIYVVVHSKSVVRFTVIALVTAVLLFRVTSGALHQAADFWAALGLLTCCNIGKLNSVDKKSLTPMEYNMAK